LVHLELDPQLIEAQAAEAAKRKADQDRSYAAHVQACVERQAKEAEQAARLAATRAAEIAEQQRAARDEWRKDLFAWTMCAQANASMTAANAALIRAANEGYGPGIVVQSQAISSAGNQIVGPVSSGHRRPGVQPPVIRPPAGSPAPGVRVWRPTPGPAPRPASPSKGPWGSAR
jgi:membrane protein involved in colicin uptake